MRTISSLLNIWLLTLIVVAGLVKTSVADNQRYPVFVDCPDFITGSHCDSFFYQAQAVDRDHDHPNNANIRYHLISGPGEINERTGLWSWKWSPEDSSYYGEVEIAASIGNSPEHTTPPDEYCRFRAGVRDNPSVILVDGKPGNSVFFVEAPGVHYFSIEVEDPDECDTPHVEIAEIQPAVKEVFYIENDQLVFAPDAVHNFMKFVVTLVDRGSPRGHRQHFIFDTRDNPVPVFEVCPDDAIITQCDKALYSVRAVDPQSMNAVGITLEVASGPGEMRYRDKFWYYSPSDADIGQTYEVEIIARYGHLVTEGDQTCRFSVTIEENVPGMSPMDFVCGDSLVIPAAILSNYRFRAFGEDCQKLTMTIVDVSPPFTGLINLRGRRRVPFDTETHQLQLLPDSLDIGQTFHIRIEGVSPMETYTCELYVTVEEPQPYSVRIETLEDAPQGQHAYLDVVLEEASIPMGRFSFVVAYNPSALAAMSASPGRIIEQCNWELFEYRFTPYGSGQLRITGRAEYGGYNFNPTCFLPDSLPATLFTIDFMVTNDRTFECDSLPIQFYWGRCGDNMIQSKEGRDLFISKDVYDAEENLLPLVDSLPSFSGVPDDCFEDKRDRIHPLIDFQHGGIHIACDTIGWCSGGDLNRNRVPFELADAVLYSNYFVRGLSVFHDTTCLAERSDVNQDGTPLSIEDLQYLIQIIVGDAEPFHQWDTTSPNPAFFRQEPDGSVSVVTPDTLGATWLHFNGVVTPQLFAGGVNMNFYHRSDSTTSVWVGSLSGGRIPAGPLLANVNAPLVEVQTCTYNGAKVEAIIDRVLGVDVHDELLPTEFALYQNYPNPFNNSTVIQFDLPRASEVQLTIYNIIGQALCQRTRYYEAGRQEFVWDGRSGSGEDVAGGVYFYRLQAGSFTETKKMLLLK